MSDLVHRKVRVVMYKVRSYTNKQMDGTLETEFLLTLVSDFDKRIAV
jgi:hypothetical protein